MCGQNNFLRSFSAEQQYLSALLAMNAEPVPPVYYESSDSEIMGGGKEQSASSEDGESVLLGLVNSYNWAGALRRIASHPAEAMVKDLQDRTPLKVACGHDAPAVVIEALLKAYPAASSIVGTTNMNPLHITCSSQHASVEVVKVLLEKSPTGMQDVAMRDVDGDTPLHAACRCGAPIEVLEVLLKANPAAVLQRDYEGLTALLRLWVRYFVIWGSDFVSAINCPSDLTGELREAWEKTKLLLRAAHVGSLDETKPFRVVHAASAVDCPREIVKLATILCPHQAEDPDEQGRLPLMIAATAPVFKVRDLSDEGYCIEDFIHGDEQHEDAQEVKEGGNANQTSVIEILLEASAEPARVPDPSGRFPLHLAVASGKKWFEGVKAILDVYPQALMLQDTNTGLYPSLLAASADKPDTTTIFELLRANPALVQGQGEEPIGGAAPS